MKKRQLLALWLLCGIILPLNTQAYEDWIYTWVDENWNEVKTVIFWWNDTFSGVQLTIKMTDQTWTWWGYYYSRWFNTPTTNSTWSGWDGTIPYTWADWKMYWNTYWLNNQWWWSGDTYANWFNPNPSEESKIARRWPCDSGYHVPSRWEWNALAIAWCNIDNWCNARYGKSWWVAWDFRKDGNWTSGNNLIRINKLWLTLWAKFKDMFGMSDYSYSYWSSSPYPDDFNSWYLYLDDYGVDPISNSNRGNGYLRVRCLRNSIVEPAPQTFTLTFLSGDVQVWSWVAISWSVYTWDVPGTGSVDPLPNMTKDGYEFDGWFLEWESEAFDFSTVEITWNIELHAEWTPIEYTITYLWTWDDYIPSATGFTIESGNITLTEPSKTWYTFTWRSGTNIEWITWTVTISEWSTWDRIYEANREANEYEITYELDGWVNNSKNVTWYTIEDTITFENPTKEWFSFDGWFTDAQFTTWITSISTWTTWPITVYAKWTENKKSSWSSGWGGRWSSKTSDIQDSSTSSQDNKNTKNVIQSETKWSEESSNTPMDSSDKSSEWQEILSPSDSSFTKEQKDAYTFAHEKWITTMPTIQEAQMDWKLTRIAMAKMLSQYAINVLWKTPDTTQNNKFNDVTDKLDSDYDDWVTLAYQLWIMWQNMPNNKFRPNDEVTRAEFATALSRMIYHTSDWQYKSTDKYYTNHMKKLVQEKIITNDDAKMKELRWYVMIMLMRSAK